MTVIPSQRKLIENHVAVITIAANDADALQESLKKAMDQGIVVISLDSAVNKDSRMLHIQPADPEKVGRVLIQAAASMIDDTGTVGIITTTGYATNQNLWIKWLKQEVSSFLNRSWFWASGHQSHACGSRIPNTPESRGNNAPHCRPGA